MTPIIPRLLGSQISHSDKGNEEAGLRMGRATSVGGQDPFQQGVGQATGEAGRSPEGWQL